jgi:hypothetical protein
MVGVGVSEGVTVSVSVGEAVGEGVIVSVGETVHVAGSSQAVGYVSVGCGAATNLNPPHPRSRRARTEIHRKNLFVIAREPLVETQAVETTDDRSNLF